MELLYRGQNLIGIFNSLVSSLEIVYVLNDMKPLAVVPVSTDRFMDFHNFCIRNKLYYVIDDFKTVPVLDRGKGSFSNKTDFVPLDSPVGDFMAYVSRDSRKTPLGKRLREDDSGLGELLGYPECCREFFERNKASQARRQFDFVLPSITEFKKGPFLNNIAIRCFDISLISHFPCSPSCKPSKRIGMERLEFLRKSYPGIADFFGRELKSLVIYTEYEGVFYSNDYNVNGRAISFAGLRGTAKNRLSSLLEKHGKIKVLGPHEFVAGGKPFKGEDYGVLIFG